MTPPGIKPRAESWRIESNSRVELMPWIYDVMMKLFRVVAFGHISVSSRTHSRDDAQSLHCTHDSRW
jgi:hypothetical protein